MMQSRAAQVPAPAMRVLYDIAGTLESAEASQERMHRALELLQRMVPYDRCALLIGRTLGSRRLIMRPENGDPTQLDDALVRRVLQQLLTLLDNDADTDIANVWPGGVAPARWKSHLAVPLIGLDRVVGVLIIGRDQSEAYDDHDLSLLSLVGAQLAAYVTALEMREQENNQARLHEQAALAVADERTAKLEELDRLKDDFIAMASHDLKSPLTSISGYAQVLRRRLANPSPNLPDLVHGLDVILEQVAAMARLLDDLLDATRIQAGGFELRTAPSNLVESLETILRRLSPEERGRIELQVPAMPPVGIWDQRRIEDVLGNLLRNALKYSPDHERISVAVEQRDSEVEVAVTDRGMGIAAEELPPLFQRFHRTRQGRDSGLPGLGLGLYICHGIIAQHGGRIWAESPGEGQGATFRFTLPIEPGRPVAI